MPTSTRPRIRAADTRALVCVVAGLGGLAKTQTMRSELERADVSNLDRLVVRSEAGLTAPLALGHTPGSLTANLSLLGYDVGANGDSAELPPFAELWGMTAVAIAAPDSGLASAASRAGMPVSATDGTMGDRIELARAAWDSAQCVFLGFEAAEVAGLAGDFDQKCHALHEFDAHVPELMSLGADVFVVAGDRSVPALVGQPTWHPVPFLLHSGFAREGNATHFNEQECIKGSIGIIRATDLLPLVTAHLQRFDIVGV